MKAYFAILKVIFESIDILLLTPEFLLVVEPHTVEIRYLIKYLVPAIVTVLLIDIFNIIQIELNVILFIAGIYSRIEGFDLVVVGIG